MNTKRVLVLAVAAVLVATAAAGGVTAQSDSGDGDLYESLEQMVPVYNQNAESLDLGPVTLAGTSNIYIQDGDSTVTYSVTMDRQNRITELRAAPNSDARRKITTDRETIEEISSADNPAAAFRTAVKNDDIVISGEDGRIVEQVKWWGINAVKGFLL
jgi:hypothetical protein